MAGAHVTRPCLWGLALCHASLETRPSHVTLRVWVSEGVSRVWRVSCRANPAHRAVRTAAMPRPAAFVRALPAKSGALLPQPAEVDVNCAHWSELAIYRDTFCGSEKTQELRVQHTVSGW